jgi:RimJ/RimL family protein N-acetyltransferase
MRSPRLRYDRLSVPHLDAFHALVQGAHVRRYLMDGEVMPRAWSISQLAASEALFETRGVGLWMAWPAAHPSDAPIGFCGFVVLPDHHPEPQLVYALPARHTGRGHASEMARAAITEARRHPGFETIHAGVDAPNTASLRVLEKLGFERTGERPGAFGREIVLESRAGFRPPA